MWPPWVGENSDRTSPPPQGGHIGPPLRANASLRRLPAWRLLLTIRLDDETALPLGWKRNPRLINRRCDQRFHVGMCQLAGRLHLDEANLLSRSPQKPPRVGQLRSLTEVQRYTGGRCADRHDGIDPSVRRRIADDEGVTVVVRQLVGGREPLTHSSPDRSKELLILRIKPVDVGPELSLRRRLLAIGFHCHRILPVVLSSSDSDPVNDSADERRRQTSARSAGYASFDQFAPTKIQSTNSSSPAPHSFTTPSIATVYSGNLIPSFTSSNFQQ